MNIRQKKKNKPSIIHMKLPVNDNGHMPVPHSIVNEFMKIAKKHLGNKYKFMASPFELSCLTGDTKIINIDCKEYSYDELQELIKDKN